MAFRPARFFWRNLRNVGDGQHRVAQARQQRQPRLPQRCIVGHHEHVDEEPVHRRVAASPARVNASACSRALPRACSMPRPAFARARRAAPASAGSVKRRPAARRRSSALGLDVLRDVLDALEQHRQRFEVRRTARLRRGPRAASTRGRCWTHADADCRTARISSTLKPRRSSRCACALGRRTRTAEPRPARRQPSIELRRPYASATRPSDSTSVARGRCPEPAGRPGSSRRPAPRGAGRTDRASRSASRPRRTGRRSCRACRRARRPPRSPPPCPAARVVGGASASTPIGR